MVKWLRENNIASGIMVLFRLYVGYHFLTAGWEKLTGEGFDASGFLKGAIAKAGGEHPAVADWWASFLNSFALPHVGLFNFLVPVGEFLVGIALILGVLTTFAALMGVIMNSAFLFSGTVSTNPQMVLLGMIILIAGYNAGKFGLDYWVIPFVRKLMKKNPKNDVTVTS